MDSWPKCVRCSALFLDGDQGIFHDGEWIHARCYRVLAGAEHVRKSQEVIALARKALADSSERIRRVQETIENRAMCVSCRRALTLDELLVAEDGLVHRGCVTPADKPPGEHRQ